MAPGGLGGGWAVVAEHEHEGAGEVVVQRAAAVVFAHRQQQQEQQEQQEQQLQGQRHAAHLPEQGAGSAPPLGLQNQSSRGERAGGATWAGWGGARVLRAPYLTSPVFVFPVGRWA